MRVPRAGLTPAAVTEEAARLCDEEGFDQLSLSAVAKRCGVAVPSLYKHVGGRAALRREVAEETDQHCGVGGLISISHHRRTRESGPESAQSDIYAVWVFFHAHVSEPRALRVTEVEGSTDDCAWFAADDLAHIPLSATARRAFTALSRAGAPLR
ncbi:TetR family transcriptional regulator [Streptomonospora algeriensis]